MTASALAQTLSLTIFTLPDPERQVSGCYCGDLLSWVMGRARAGDGWVTIMSSRNVGAVAALSDVGCVILSEGVVPDPDLLEAAASHGVNLLGSPLPTANMAAALLGLLS